MLGRAGITTILIDPHETYPFDFRVEKLSGDAQLERFFRTGIADSVLRSVTHDGENWIARFGYLLDKRPSRQVGTGTVGLIAITTPPSLQALGAAATAAAGAGCAAFAGVRSRAADRLRSDSQVICPGQYRRACRPCCGARPTTGP
jgi:hypothetical protein